MSNELINKARELTLADLFFELQLVRQDIAALRSDLATTFAADEFDPKRREMSNKLGEQAINRLKVEDRARKITTGEWPDEDKARFRGGR